MRTLTLLIFSISLLTSCEANKIVDNEETPTKSLIDQRFQTCYYENDLAKNKCDSVLRSFFGKKNFLSLKLNRELSFIGCDENEDLEMLIFGNENCCVPRTYDLVYDIKINNELIYQISMVAGSEMKFDFISPDAKEQLEGYKLLLEDKLMFDYNDICLWMRAEGLNLLGFTAELYRDTLQSKSNLSSYFWEVDNLKEENNWNSTRLNAMTGRRFK